MVKGKGRDATTCSVQGQKKQGVQPLLNAYPCPHSVTAGTLCRERSYLIVRIADS